MWSVTHATRKDIIPTSALTDSQERLWALAKMGSLVAHTTKQTHTALRSAGICIRTLKIRLAEGKAIAENSSLIPGAQRLQMAEVWELPVERSYRRCLQRSCLRRMRPRQNHAEKCVQWQCCGTEGANKANVRH
jgi:hypothetical protein